MPPAAAAPPLSGIRVLDLTTAPRRDRRQESWRTSVPRCSRSSHPRAATRAACRPSRTAARAPRTARYYWAAYGRGKRSITLDIASAEGRTQLRTLAAGADILLESFESGQPRRPRAGLRGPARAQPGARVRLGYAVRAERTGRTLAGDGPDDRGGGRPALADRRRRLAARAGRLPAGRAARRGAGRRGRRRRTRRARPLRPRAAPRRLAAGPAWSGR